MIPEALLAPEMSMSCSNLQNQFAQTRSSEHSYTMAFIYEADPTRYHEGCMYSNLPSFQNDSY